MKKDTGSLIPFMLTLSILGAACSTTEKEPGDIEVENGEDGSEASQPVASVVDVGGWEVERTPWPSGSPIWHKVLSSNDVVTMQKIYDAWDFNGDGRVDMVQRLSVTGEVLNAAFDFDLDGDIDAVKTYMADP